MEKASHDATHQSSKQLGAQKQIDPAGLSIGHEATLLHLAETQRQVKTRNFHVGKKGPPVTPGKALYSGKSTCACAL